MIQLSKVTNDPASIRAAVRKLRDEGYTRAVINSSAGGWITSYLDEAGVSCVGLVHEMPDIIRRMQLQEGIAAFEKHAKHVVFSSDFVRKQIESEILGHTFSRSVVCPQGNYKAESVLSPSDKEQSAASVRAPAC